MSEIKRLKRWAKHLDNATLVRELVVLGRKCQSRVYGGGMAGKLLKAAKAEAQVRNLGTANARPPEGSANAGGKE
jgi:hypothetical protein